MKTTNKLVVTNYSEEVMRDNLRTLSRFDHNAFWYIAGHIANDTNTDGNFIIDMRDFCETMGLSGHSVLYKYVKNLANKLLEMPLEIQQDGYVIKTRWFSYVGILENHSTLMIGTTQYALLYIRAHEWREELEEISQMKSKYGVRLYDLLKDYKGKKVKVAVDDLRWGLCAGESKSAQQFKYFNERILSTAVCDINQNSDMTVEMTFRKYGRRVTHIIFKITDAVKLDDHRITLTDRCPVELIVPD